MDPKYIEHDHNDKYYSQAEANNKFCSCADLHALLSNLIYDLAQGGQIVMEHTHDDLYKLTSEIEDTIYTKEQCDAKFITREEITSMLEDALSYYYTKAELDQIFPSLTGGTGATGGSGGTGYTGGSGATGGSGGTGYTGGTGGTGSTGGTGGTGLDGAAVFTGNTGGTGMSGRTGGTGASGNTGHTGGTGSPAGRIGLLGNTALLFGGWNGTTHIEVLEGIDLSTTSNGVYFGDLQSVLRRSLGVTSNGYNSRGVAGGGYDGEIFFTNIDYQLMLSPGDSSPFGNLLSPKANGAALSNASLNRGIFASGHDDDQLSSTLDEMEFINILTTSDTSLLGVLETPRMAIYATSNGANNRGVISGGYNWNVYMSVIEYLQISLGGDAQAFGNLAEAKGYGSATSNGVNGRAIVAGGINTSTGWQSDIEYFDIDNFGDAQTFGQLDHALTYLMAGSNGAANRGITIGGIDATTHYNAIEYIDISTPADAADFGDLEYVRYAGGAACNA
jgi:hypothetical protein